MAASLLSRIRAALSRVFRRSDPIPFVQDFMRETAGEGVTVCVLDSGAPDHPALADSIDFGASRSFVYDEPGIGDENGHATAVCGILHEYAPRARIVCYKIAGKGGRGTATNLRLALEAACKLKPDAVLVGIAFGCGASKCLHALGVLESLGIPVICAAGNDGDKGVQYPARFPQTLAVGACDRKGRAPSWSAQGPELDCLYPGVRIETLWLNGRRAAVSGTSFAAPAAAGIAALWLAWRKEMWNLVGGNYDKPFFGETPAGVAGSCRNYVRHCGVFMRGEKEGGANV